MNMYEHVKGSASLHSPTTTSHTVGQWMVSVFFFLYPTTLILSLPTHGTKSATDQLGT